MFRKYGKFVTTRSRENVTSDANTQLYQLSRQFSCVEYVAITK